MKKTIVLMIITMMASIPAAHALDRPQCSDIDMTWLRTHSPIPSGKIVSKQETGDLCEIILGFGNEFVPVYAGKDFIIAGEMLKDRQQITRTRIDTLKANRFRKLIPKLDAVAAITYSPKKKTDQKIFMITDPLCPYCNMAAKRIIPLADTYGATIKTVLYSVHGAKGDAKSVEATCRQFTLDQYAEKEWKSQSAADEHQCEAGAALVDKTRDTVLKLGIGGVPVFIFEDGRFVNGANMAEVEKILKEQG